MSKPKHIRPDELVGLKITAAERNLLCEDVTFLDDEYPDAIRQTPADQPVKLTLADWDDLGGYIAAESNHTTDKKLGKKLDAIFDKIQKLLDTYTNEEPPKTVKIAEARKAEELSKRAVQVAEWVAKVLVGAEELGIKHKPVKTFWLSPEHRDVLRLAPTISEGIKSKLAKRKASFTLAEVAGMAMALAEDLPDSRDQEQVARLIVTNHLMERLLEAFGPRQPQQSKAEKPKAKTSSATVFQFKITLRGIEPPIWRRIQVKDCTLDKLHEHIQTAMGWTNSHLHQFKIGGIHYGDPELLCEGFGDDPEIVNSLDTRLVKVVPKNGKRFRFEYEYDFGDGWEHEILFEGSLLADEGTRYPMCLEGQRACPPEDVGGTYGYQEYLEALANPKHERHKEFMEWSGRFNPEKFDAKAATKGMQQGLPDWREME